jgi:hypothetical protein
MYTLRVPFGLPPGQAIAIDDRSVHFDGLDCTLSKQDRFYVLTLTGFSKEEDAKRFISNVWACLMWVLLQCGLSPNAVLQIQEIVYFPKPDEATQNLSASLGIKIDGPVDGLIDGELPAVFHTDKHLRTLTGGLASVVITTPAERVFRYIRDAVALPLIANIIEDSKLSVALELYAAYFREPSANARLLTLVMSLEALAIGTTRPPLVLDLLRKWKTEVDHVLETLAPESDDAASLEALSRELLFRREDSIRRQIRNLVLSELKSSGDHDAPDVAKRAVGIYDQRSTLVHEGKVESQVLGAAISDAKRIVERVLRARFLRVAQGSP